MKEPKLMVVNLPNPSRQTLLRDSAGGFGVILPTTIRHTDESNVYPNPFLSYSASVSHDMSVEYKLLDTQVLKLSENEILKRLKKYDPDIIFSMMSLPSIYNDIKFLNMIKKEMPKAIVAVCGSVCRTLTNDILLNSNVDVVTRDFFPYVSGLRNLLINYPYENKFKNLNGFSYIHNDNIKHNLLKPIGVEFYNYKPLYHDLPLEKYWRYPNSHGRRRLLFPILGAIGCPHSCSYCPYPIGFGKKIRFNDPKSIADEIEYLNQLGVDHILFRNQCFTYDEKWLANVCSEIIKRKLDVEWICEARVDEVTKDNLKCMWNSGCRKILFGVETGDPSLMKQAKPGIHLQDIHNVFKLTKEMNFKRIASIILGFPGENKVTLEKTTDFVMHLKPDILSINFLTPYPGTELFKIADKENLLITRNWKYYTSFNVVMAPSDLHPEDLLKAANQLKRQFSLSKAKNRVHENFNIKSVKRLLSLYFQSMLQDQEISWI